MSGIVAEVGRVVGSHTAAPIRSVPLDRRGSRGRRGGEAVQGRQVGSLVVEVRTDHRHITQSGHGVRCGLDHRAGGDFPEVIGSLLEFGEQVFPVGICHDEGFGEGFVGVVIAVFVDVIIIIVAE